MDKLFQSGSEMSSDELMQVAGGSVKETNAGLGAVACYGLSVGLGNPTGFCVGIGFSDGRRGVCAGKGTVYNATEQ